MVGQCIACHLKGIVDRCHIKTRGAGAGWEDWEWMPLCRRCHIEQGQLGWYRMASKYHAVDMALCDKGWRFYQRGKIWKIERTEA